MPAQTLGLTCEYRRSIGRAEFSGSGFRQPVDLARGAGDLLYVLSRAWEYRPDGRRVTICTVEEDYIGEFAKGASVGDTNLSDADGSLIWPTSIALDKEGNVYVADEWLNRISMFTKDGDWIGKWGTPGEGDGEINRPSGLAFDNENNLYLVDSLNNRVQKFTKNGKFLDHWGRAGSGDGEFNMPWGVDIDSDGDMYVADWRNDRIQKLAPDGQFLMKFGRSGVGDGEFNRPTGVAVDKDGIVYVADWGNNRFQMFGPDGSFIKSITGDATLSQWGKDKLDANSYMWEEREISQGLEREKLFWGPIAVEVDDENRIFVADSARSRIQVYRKLLPIFVGPKL